MQAPLPCCFVYSPVYSHDTPYYMLRHSALPSKQQGKSAAAMLAACVSTLSIIQAALTSHLEQQVVHGGLDCSAPSGVVCSSPPPSPSRHHHDQQLTSWQPSPLQHLVQLQRLLPQIQALLNAQQQTKSKHAVGSGRGGGGGGPNAAGCDQRIVPRFATRLID